MYALIGYYPNSHLGWRLMANWISGVCFIIVGIQTGLYFMAFVQAFAGVMVYIQYKSHKGVDSTVK
jgi:hypothetical protein